MVAKVISGKSIPNVLRYNERKVKRGFAVLLGEDKFGVDSGELTFSEKVQRFALLTGQNKKVKTNAVHISLNFLREDLLGTDRLLQIAKAYMEGIGFGDQPYLVYEHYDTAHPHLHIVTTNVQEGGGRINLHNIGRERSEPTRKAIEQNFGLIPAESRKREGGYSINRVDLAKVRYGEVETKAAISSVVREVVRVYRFTSLEGLQATLEQFGVTVDGGKPGSRIYDKGGLIYSLLDEGGKRIGVPIKASSIFSKPTLKNLTPKFTTSALARQQYAARLTTTIDRIMAGPLRPLSDSDFTKALAERKIHVHFQKDEYGQPTDVIYVDNKTRVVFKGSELGEAYALSGIRSRMTPPVAGAVQDAAWNAKFVSGILRSTDFSQNFPQIVAGWAVRGLLIRARTAPDGITQYWLGHKRAKDASLVAADEKLSRWFKVNHVTEAKCSQLQQRLPIAVPQHFAKVAHSGSSALMAGLMQATKEVIALVVAVVEEVFRLAPGHSYVPYQLLQSSRIKKRTKKRGQSPQ